MPSHLHVNVNLLMEADDEKKARLTEIVGSEFVNGGQPDGDSSIDANSPSKIEKVENRTQ